MHVLPKVVIGKVLVGATLVVPLRDALSLRLLNVLTVGGGRLLYIAGLVVESRQSQKCDSTFNITDTVSFPEALHGVRGLFQFFITFPKSYKHSTVARPQLLSLFVVIEAIEWHLQYLIGLPQPIPSSIISSVHFNCLPVCLIVTELFTSLVSSCL